jgi:hypothetical protein
MFFFQFLGALNYLLHNIHENFVVFVYGHNDQFKD